MIFIVCNKIDAMMHAHYMWFELHNCHSSLHATINVREKEKKERKWEVIPFPLLSGNHSQENKEKGS